MLGDITGYVLVKNDAKCEHAVMHTPEELQGKIFRALELNDSTKSALIIDNKAVAIDMIDYNDIERKFHCIKVNDVILPPGEDMLVNMFEAERRLLRKGGYDSMVRGMVIASSLHKEKFNDDFLFQKQ